MSLQSHTALSIESEVVEAGPSTPTSSPPPNNSRSRTKTQTKTKTKAKTTENKLKTTKPRTKPIPRPIQAFSDPSVGEEETVHEIYESIAPHFALTRHKEWTGYGYTGFEELHPSQLGSVQPWPLITSFLSSLPPHSLGLDSGAGNGKYLPTAHSLGHTMIAMDRSLGLLGIAKEQEGAGDVVRGDLGGRGWRDGVFDFTISVAAIHHLSTPTRRRQAVQAILPTLSHNRKAPYSRFFIYVWAYEQGGMSKREMGSAANANANAPKEHEQEQEHEQGEKQEQEHEQEADEPGQTGGKNSDRGSASGSTSGDTNIVQDGAGAGTGGRGRIQDVLVPWVLKSNSTSSKRKTKSSSSSKPTPKFKSTNDDVKQTSQSPNTDTIGKIEKEDTGEQPEGEKEREKEEKDEGEEEKVYHRYYHLFVQGELRDLINEAGIAEGYRIIPSTPLSSSGSETLSNSDIPLSSLSISPPPSTTAFTSTSSTMTTSLEAELGRDEKWLRIRGEGWEADNWWVEAEVGVGAIVDY